MKTCSRCKQEKPETDFHEAKRFPDGRQKWCKSCVKAHMANPEAKERKAKRRKERREDVEYRRRENELQKAHYDRNIERYLVKGARHRAKTGNLPFDITEEDITVPKLCPVLKKPLKRHTRYAPTIDRIIPELGYVKGNVMVVSYKANVMKNDASEEDLKNFCEYYTKHTQGKGD